jgi:hypothetical protein
MSFDPSTAVLLEEDAPAFDPTTAVPLEEFDVSSAVLVEEDPALPAAVPSPVPQPDEAIDFLRDAERNGQAADDQGIKEGIFPQGSTPWKTLDGRLYIDPARYNMAVEQMWNLGVIDSTNYTELLKGTVDQWDEASQSYIPSVEKATAARRDLERRAGAFPEAKAAASGLLKGAMQTGAALVAGPATAALTFPTGPGAIGVGILAGTGTAIGVGAAYDKALKASAKESELLDSFYAANQLAPGYNSAGQLVSILAPTPVSVSRLANAANLIRTEKGGAEAAKFISGALGTGASIGVGTDVAIQAANIGLDKLIHPEINPLIAAEQYRQTGQQPPQRPEFDPASTAISGTLGALTAGIGVKARNKTYAPEELVTLENQVRTGRASRQEAEDYNVMRQAVQTLRADERLIDAQAIRRATVDAAGFRFLDTTEIINPRFQQAALADAGFTPRPSQPAIPYATENPVAAIPLQGQPATYTGQAFLNRGGAAPAFQGGSNALPGPEGIQALPGPAAVNPQVNPPDTFDPSTATEIPPTASAPVASTLTAPASTGSPEVIAGEGASVSKPKRRFPRISYDPGTFPILSALQESPVRTSASGKAGGENDNWNEIRRTGRHFAETHRSTGTPYDVRAQELYDQGLIADPYPDTLFNAYMAEVNSYRQLKDGDPQQAEYDKLQKQYDNFSKAALDPSDSKKAKLQPISANSLQIGDKVKIGDEWLNVKAIDPETFTISLQDGTKFGLQKVEDGTQMWVQEAELAAPPTGDIDNFFGEPIDTPAPAKQDDPFSGNIFSPSEMPFSLDRPVLDDSLTIQREADEAKRQQAAYEEAQKGQTKMAFADAGPPAKSSRSGSKTMADAGPPTPVIPAGSTIPKPALETYNDAQVFADYPDAVGVVRAMNGTWTMPLILGGLDKVPVVEMPEAVEFVKALSGGSPTVQIPRKRNALGSFSPNGQGVITLHPDLIKAGGEASAMMTFMHEIGHNIQFMDDFKMEKGNLLGIISGNPTLKHSIPLDPNPAPVEGWAYSQQPITSKQRENIRKKAEADLRASLEGEVRKVIVNEPIYAQSGVTPEIVKGLFGLDAREQWPELYDWFARQDGATKANIVKQAMKGILDARLAKFQVQGAQIGTNTREETQTVGGREPTQDELREAFHAAMRSEMNARNVADLKYIRQELIDLTKWWKPFDITRATPEHLAYRFSPEELFADAMSVLLNSPADLKARAPIFYDTFWNNLDSRPQVKTKLAEIYDRISKGRDAVLDKRLARDMEAFKAGAEIFISKNAAAQARRASLTGWWENLKDQYWNIYQPIIDSAAKARAAGKITPAQEDSIRWLTEEHPLAESKLQVKLADIGRLYQSLDAAGVARENFGIFLKYHRIANERLEVTREIDGQMEVVGETGRAVMFNPGGETDRTAREALARLQATLGPEGYAALETAVSGFRDVIYSIMEDANQSGLFSAELWKTISTNKDNYAAFTPLEYVQEYLPSTIRKQVGTFKEIADPLQQTVLKVISIHRAAQNNRFTREAVRVIRQTSPELVTTAPMKYNGKTMEPQPPKDSALSMVEWKVNGQRVGAHIPKRYAAMWEDKSPAERDAILRLLSTGFQRLVYGAIIRYNPAFQLFMSPARDLQRSLTNMPGGIKGRARFLMRLLDPEAWGASIDWAQGDVGKTQLMREMVESAATGGPHSAFGGRMGSNDDSIDAILRKFHLQDSKSRNLLTRAIMGPLKAIEFAGQILQMLPKASAYKVLVKDMGMPAPQAANTIRNHIGIPNYYKKGRHAQSAGAIVPFLNIFLRSYESLQRNFRGAERNMNAKEWWLAWLFTGGGLIAVLQTLAKEGVLGEELQKLYSRVPNWDMTNFAVIPLGNVSTGDTGGKTAYLRLPQDEGLRVINGVVGKVLSASIRSAKGDPTAPQLGDVFAGISSQVPGQNTLIEVGQNWTTFLAGRNPRDDFRNRNILSEDQWLAGGWEATKPMLGWTLGATGITNFFNYDTEADTLTEMTISATPVLNKFLKISDRGVYQNDLKLNQADERDMAKVRLSLPDFVNGLRTEYNYLKTRSEQRSERENDRYLQLGAWNRAYRNAMDEVETSMELGNRSSAQSAIRSLVQESKYYKQR